eukprot:51549-Eustigmatos_ZCMA.PRE.1
MSSLDAPASKWRSEGVVEGPNAHYEPEEERLRVDHVQMTAQQGKQANDKSQRAKCHLYA